MKFATLTYVPELAGDPPAPLPLPSPVTVERWIEQGRINPQTATVQPELLQRQLNAAVERCQDWCCRSFVTQTLLATYLQSPPSGGGGCGCGFGAGGTSGIILLPRGTVQSVESVIAGGVVIDSTGYTSEGNAIVLAAPARAAAVTWKSGYGTADQVPDAIKEGIYEYATVLYENRLGERQTGTGTNRTDSATVFMPRGIQDILRPFQIDFEG